ncbi:MAG: 50S ribosomal protein L29 [Bacteroidetes bacterium]|jgi:large subunit ribosomal protein L29|nr:50S ribosomal protein L29 [Bacteroidota bacterium]
MKARKAADLKGLPTNELVAFLKESEENITKLRFQLVLGQLQDTTSIRTMRKDIARMKTILAQRENSAN